MQMQLNLSRVKWSPINETPTGTFWGRYGIADAIDTDNVLHDNSNLLDG